MSVHVIVRKSSSIPKYFSQRVTATVYFEEALFGGSTKMSAMCLVATVPFQQHRLPIQLQRNTNGSGNAT
eukprot:5918472-Amphidinium_carterae.1